MSISPINPNKERFMRISSQLSGYRVISEISPKVITVNRNIGMKEILFKIWIAFSK